MVLKSSANGQIIEHSPVIQPKIFLKHTFYFRHKEFITIDIISKESKGYLLHYIESSGQGIH